MLYLTLISKVALKVGKFHLTTCTMGGEDDRQDFRKLAVSFGEAREAKRPLDESKKTHSRINFFKKGSQLRFSCHPFMPAFLAKSSFSH